MFLKIPQKTNSLTVLQVLFFYNGGFKIFVSTHVLSVFNITELNEFTFLQIQKYKETVCKMCFSEQKLTDGEGGSVKKSKKKQKQKDAWRPEGPRDPFAMVCVSVCVRLFALHYIQV